VAQGNKMMLFLSAYFIYQPFAAPRCRDRDIFGCCSRIGTNEHRWQ